MQRNPHSKDGNVPSALHHFGRDGLDVLGPHEPVQNVRIIQIARR